VITAVSVLIPVQNEERLLPRCLAGVREALANLDDVYPGVEALVVFALDGCTDESANLITDAGFTAVRSLRTGVGAARSTAATAALNIFSDTTMDDVWLSCTDADSVVPAIWLTRQIDLAVAGADVVVGSVHPDPIDLDNERRKAWRATHDAGQADGHVHGANLGIRASAYRRAGGFQCVSEHEDVELVTRARASGATISASGDHSVLTSGRLFGRTAGGYAGYLRDQLIPLASQRASNATF
jgi:glycosyltransferase involved in cell wall biosynthesis